MTFIGIDLAGSEKRPTGLCFLAGKKVETCVVFSNRELLEHLAPLRPTLVGIDAPLFLPLGRCCLRNDCTCAGTIHFRECDLELRRRKIPFFPITLGPMRQLTMRGMELSRLLEGMGHTPLETYPGAAQDLWKIPRQKNPRGLRRGLGRFVKFRKRGISRHELDAVTCALLAQHHYHKRTELIGRPEEGWMVLPVVKSSLEPRSPPL